MQQVNRVICGDCLEVLKDFPDNSVDAIVTDPPYFKVKKEWWDRQWEKSEGFLSWLDSIAEQWQRILKSNGSLYCFASPKMAARVEVLLGERFNVVNRITWNKGDLPTGGRHASACKETLRGFFPASESIIFCEHYGADNIAKGEAGYGAKCDALRGFVFEPLRAYLDGERIKAGFLVQQVKELWQKDKQNKGGIAGHWFTDCQWRFPSGKSYLWLQQAFPGYFTRPYEELRLQYFHPWEIPNWAYVSDPNPF